MASVGFPNNSTLPFHRRRDHFCMWSEIWDSGISFLILAKTLQHHIQLSYFHIFPIQKRYPWGLETCILYKCMSFCSFWSECLRLPIYFHFTARNMFCLTCSTTISQLHQLMYNAQPFKIRPFTTPPMDTCSRSPEDFSILRRIWALSSGNTWHVRTRPQEEGGERALRLESVWICLKHGETAAWHCGYIYIYIYVYIISIHTYTIHKHPVTPETARGGIVIHVIPLWRKSGSMWGFGNMWIQHLWVFKRNSTVLFFWSVSCWRNAYFLVFCSWKT